MSYTPQPGTLPARALEWFRAQPPGAMVATAVLAEFLGVDQMQIHGSLQYPRDQGAFVSEKREGRVYWGLGTGAPAASDEDEDTDTPPTKTTRAADGDLACALWTTGVLQIRKGKHAMELTAGDVKVLVSYLSRLLNFRQERPS
jgi:hypothetical protein